jgi:anti-anti-sigma regulatory factor
VVPPLEAICPEHGIVTVWGGSQLNRTTTAQLLDALQELDGQVALDINDVDVLDTTALKMLSQFQKQLEAKSSTLWLRGVRGCFTGAFQDAGGDKQFRIADRWP